MTQFMLNIYINKPPEVVTAALLDPDKAVQWTKDLVRFEVVEGKPGEVGSKARLHYAQKGRAYVMEETLIHADPGRKYVSQVDGGNLEAKVETTLRPSGLGTEMILVWTGKGKGPFLNLLLPLLRGKIMKQGMGDLERFRGMVEEQG